MSIVVTGASGFIGSTLLPHLSGTGLSCVAIDRRPLPDSTAHLPAVSSLSAELTAPTVDVLDALRHAAAVVHLAGCPGVRDAGVDVAFRRQRDNVDAVRAVLRSTPRDTPVVVLSSSSVYGGATPAQTGLGAGRRIRASHEDDPLCARGGYAASKIAAEQVCRERARSGGHTLVVRPFTVLGEGQRPDMAVARWAVEASATGAVTVLGSPDRTRDFTDVRDIARALLALLHAGRSGTVNVGTGRGHSLTELASAVCAAVGLEPQVRVRPAAPAEVAHTRADTDRLRDWAGFVPATDLHGVVARSVSSLAEPRHGDPRIEGPQAMVSA